MGFLRTIRGKVIVGVFLGIAILLSIVVVQGLGLTSLKRTEIIMGTLIEITVIPANEKAVGEAFEAIKCP